MVIVDHHEYLCEEEKRLKEDRERTKYWKRWGPYVAERQWATGQLTQSRVPNNSAYSQLDLTVREDYSYVIVLPRVQRSFLLTDAKYQGEWRCLEPLVYTSLSPS